MKYGCDFLGNVLPTLSCAYAMNGFISNEFESRPNGFGCFSIGKFLPYFTNLMFCKFMHSMRLATTHWRDAISHSSLRARISHIVAVGSEKEMARITASPIVASVTNVQTINNGSVDQFVSHSMSTRFLAMFFTFPIASCLIKRFFPVPAFIKSTNIYVAEEPLPKRWLLGPFGNCSLIPTIDVTLVCSHAVIIALVSAIAQGLLWH